MKRRLAVNYNDILKRLAVKTARASRRWCAVPSSSVRIPFEQNSGNNRIYMAPSTWEPDFCTHGNSLNSQARFHVLLVQT